MFEITVEESFAAGHALRGYKGKCENVHGHNYKVRVTLEGDALDATGLLYDFQDLRKTVRELIQAVDHRFINEVPPFDVENPSAENLAKYFFQGVKQHLTAVPDGARVRKVTVFETEATTATYRE
jgi:6-pyruvoyltetrahydropterin/6-carboxytetrahydropterin synthase